MSVPQGGVCTVFREFEFNRPESAEYAYTSRLRLAHDYAGGGAQAVLLARDGAGYPTEGVHAVRTPYEVAARAVGRRLLDAEYTAPAGTTVTFRLDDGERQLCWDADGAEWRAAADPEEDWSTLEDCNAHLQDLLPVPVRLAVWARLKTTDARRTPRLVRVGWLLEARVPSWQDDFVYDTLLRALREVRAAAEYLITVPADEAAAELPADAAEDLGLSVVDVAGAFAYPEDEACRENLLASYDAETRTVNLNGEPAAEDRRVRLFLTYRPEVIHSRHEDFEPVSRTPAVVLTGLKTKTVRLVARGGYVRNLAAFTVVGVPAPALTTYTGTLRVEAARGEDLHRLSAAVREWLRETPLLRTYATGEPIRFQHSGDWRQVRALEGDVAAAETTFHAYHVPEQTRPTWEVPVIKRRNWTTTL